MDVTLLYRSGIESSVSFRVCQSEVHHFHLFVCDIAIQVLHSYMGVMPERQPSAGNSGLYVDSIIVMLARLDVFMATAISYLRDNGTDKVDVHRQKFYYKTFYVFHTLAYDQFVSDI